jgi:predicted dehydrogenase
MLVHDARPVVVVLLRVNQLVFALVVDFGSDVLLIADVGERLVHCIEVDDVLSRIATGHKASNAIEIIGSEGTVRFDLERLNELELFDADGRGFERISVTDPGDPYMDTWWPADHTIGWEHTIIHENYEFLTVIAENRAPKTGIR